MLLKAAVFTYWTWNVLQSDHITAEEDVRSLFSNPQDTEPTSGFPRCWSPALCHKSFNWVLFLFHTLRLANTKNQTRIINPVKATESGINIVMSSVNMKRFGSISHNLLLCWSYLFARYLYFHPSLKTRSGWTWRGIKHKILCCHYQTHKAFSTIVPCWLGVEIQDFMAARSQKVRQNY